MYAPSWVLTTSWTARISAVFPFQTGVAKVKGIIPLQGFKGEQPQKSKTQFCVTQREAVGRSKRNKH